MDKIKEKPLMATDATLLDYFAAKAMNAYHGPEDAPVDFMFVATRAYQMAECMMEVRKNYG
jgi:hypothetical protein